MQKETVFSLVLWEMNNNHLLLFLKSRAQTGMRMAVTSLPDPGNQIEKLRESTHYCNNDQAEIQSETASASMRSQCTAVWAWWGFMFSLQRGVEVQMEMEE